MKGMKKWEIFEKYRVIWYILLHKNRLLIYGIYIDEEENLWTIKER